MLFVIIGLLFLAIFLSGVMSADARRERHRRRLIQRGAEVRATVIEAAPTGHKRAGLAEVKLELELDDGRHARAEEAMTPAELGRCRRGATVRAVVAGDEPPLCAVVTRYG